MRRDRQELLRRSATGGIGTGPDGETIDACSRDAVGGGGDRVGGPAAETVRVRAHPGLGDVVVVPGGTTLYAHLGDEPGSGSSACVGNCANAWPPVTVDGEPTGGPGVDAALGTFERDDGRSQVTCGGWPLYTFVNDEAPGDAGGQGINDAWFAVRPDGTPTRSRAERPPTRRDS